MTKLGEVTEIIMGQSPPSSTYRKQPEGVPFFQGAADFGLVHPTVKTWCVAPRKLGKANDVLLSVRAPVGETNLAEFECCIGRGLAAVRCRNGSVIPEYLALWLKSKRVLLESLSTGTTFQGTNKATLSNLEFPLVPLDLQRLLVPCLQAQKVHTQIAEKHWEMAQVIFDEITRRSRTGGTR